MMLRRGLCGGRAITCRTSCSFLHWRWFLLTLAVCLGSLSCCRINLGPPWWDFMVDKYLHVFLSTEDTITPDHISIYRNTTPNLLGTSTKLHCCLQTHYCTALQPFGEQTGFCCSQVLLIWTHQSRAPAAVLLHPTSCVFLHCWAAWPWFHVRGMGFSGSNSWPDSGLALSGSHWFLPVLSWHHCCTSNDV